ncbi:MAG TPA: hypothetical protein VF281_02320 [Candidatus Saccharimonadales bacterium]
MRELLSVFYGAVFVIVSFNGASRVTARFLAKAHADRVRKTEQYLKERVALDQSFRDDWSNIELYDQRLWEHIHHKAGKHAQPVSDQEIDMFIQDCLRFSEKVKVAIRQEHRLLKKLSADEIAKLPVIDHPAWHPMYYNARRIIRKFQVLRMNVYRPTTR